MGSALLVVDVQNGVVEGIESAAATIGVIATLVARARAAGRPVVWVQHEDADLPPHTHAWQVVPAMRVHPEDLRVAKQHRSVFAGTGLGEWLRTRGVTRLVLTGAQSAFCVDMAGKHALAEGFDVTLVRDGHCNGALQTDAGELTDAQVRGLVNRTWSTMRHPGRLVEVSDADAIDW